MHRTESPHLNGDPEPVTEFDVFVSEWSDGTTGGLGRSCSLTSDLNANLNHDHAKKLRSKARMALSAL